MREACIWWMAELVPGTGLPVHLHTWRCCSSRGKEETPHSRLILARASHAAFRAVMPSAAPEGSFPPLPALGPGMLPSMTDPPRPIQFGNGNFTALLCFIVPNVQMNSFIEIRGQYLSQDKLAHWLQQSLAEWCRLWDSPCLVKPHSGHFIWMNADWREGLGSISSAGTVKLSCIRFCVDQLPTGCSQLPKSVAFQGNILPQFLSKFTGGDSQK